MIYHILMINIYTYKYEYICTMHICCDCVCKIIFFYFIHYLYSYISSYAYRKMQNIAGRNVWRAPKHTKAAHYLSLCGIDTAWGQIKRAYSMPIKSACIAPAVANHRSMVGDSQKPVCFTKKLSLNKARRNGAAQWQAIRWLTCSSHVCLNRLPRILICSLTFFPSPPIPQANDIYFLKKKKFTSSVEIHL